MFQKNDTDGISLIKKPKNNKNRTRNQLLNFHLTSEEREYIFERVALSGLTKQEYFLQSLMFQQVVCIGNVRIYDEMKKQLSRVEKRLMECNSLGEIEQEKLEALRMILELLNGLESKDFESIRSKSNAPIVQQSNIPRYKNGTVKKRKIRKENLDKELEKK